MKPLTVVIGLVVLAGGFAYFGTSFRDPAGIRLSGVVSANEVIVAAKIDGRITRLHVNEGSRVALNDLIAELGREEIEPERERQAAAVQQQEAKLVQSREQLRLDRDRARTQLAGAEASLQLARSQRDEAQAELGQLQRDFERSSGLVQQGLLARQEAEKVETSLRVAQARIRSLDDRVRVAQAELDLARANERQVAVSSQDVEQIRALRDQAKAQLSQSTARVGYTEVRAPLSGVVSLRVARQGEVIRQGDPIVTIIDLDDVWVRAEVEESYMGRVLVGQVLPVRLASGEELQGRVTFIAPETDFATQRDVNRTKRDIKTFGIKVALANPEHRLHSGMTAYVMLPATPPAAATRNAQAPPPPPAAAAVGGNPAPAAQRPIAPVPPAPSPASVALARPGVVAAAPAVVAAGPAAVKTPPPKAASAPAAANADEGEGEEDEEADDPAEVPKAAAPKPAVSVPALPTSRHVLRSSPVTKSSTGAPVVPAMGTSGMPAPGATPRAATPGAASSALASPAAAPPASVPPALAPPALKPPVPNLPVAVPEAARPKPATGSDLPHLSLEAISVINGKTVAVINKQKLVPGETIAGARVIRILDYQVELEYQGRRFAIGL